ncbi:MFS transporter [Tsukamurella sp. 1534]|uniref:MFS transporter n=1 Tax=Tsukamurella sp. 1534 TaxID=1151061 RepID=UPI000305D090|nr:MFS transporter [Tsukamurella sp. 1534]
MTATAAPTAVRPRVAGAFLLLFLIGAETFLLSPLLPAITDALSTNVAAAANATTAYVLVYAVASPLLGSLSDRIGRRTPLLAGAALFLVANLACAAAPHVAVLIAARAVGGLGAALAGPSIWAYLADSAPDPESIGRFMGRGMAFFSSGQVIGIPVGAGIAAAADWRWSFVALAAGTAVAVGVLARAVPRTAPAATPPSVRDGLRVALAPAIAPILVVTLVVQFFSLGTYAYVGQLLHERLGWDTATLGLVGVLVGLGSVAGSLIGGRLTRTGLPAAARIGLWIVVVAAGVVVFALTGSAVPALVALFVWFVGSGGFVTEQQTSLALAAGDRRAAASAWNTSFMHAGTAIGVVVVGAALPAAAVAAAIAGGALALGVTAVSAVRGRP